VLKKFQEALAKRYEGQLKYNYEENIPRGIVKAGDAEKHALEVALVSTIGEYVHWEPEGAREIAANIVEDVNFHDLAKAIREF